MGQLLCNPTKGLKSELVTSYLQGWGRNLAFPGAHKGAKLLRISCILGGPQQRGQNQSSLPHTFAFLWANKFAESLGPLCIISRPQQRAQNQNWLPPTFAFSGGGIATSPLLHFGGPHQGGQIQNCSAHLLKGP